MSATDTTEQPAFAEWAIVELLGHRRVAGFAQEVRLASAGFLRVDIPGVLPCTQFVNPAVVYALHPVTEDVARRAAAAFADQMAPVSRWELPDGPSGDESEPVRRWEVRRIAQEGDDEGDDECKPASYEIEYVPSGDEWGPFWPPKTPLHAPQTTTHPDPPVPPITAVSGETRRQDGPSQQQETTP